MSLMTGKEKRADSPSFGKEGDILKDPEVLDSSVKPETSRINKSHRSPRKETKDDPETLKNQKFQIEDPEIKQLFEQNRDALFRIFRYYASFGEPMNYNSLKSSKFIKLMKEAGIVQVSYRYFL